MEGRLSFKECLERYKGKCSSQLLTKAYEANKLAKLAHGSARLRLYGLKYKYLSKAIELNPYEFRVVSHFEIVLRRPYPALSPGSGAGRERGAPLSHRSAPTGRQGGAGTFFALRCSFLPFVRDKRAPNVLGKPHAPRRSVTHGCRETYSMFFLVSIFQHETLPSSG